MMKNAILAALLLFIAYPALGQRTIDFAPLAWPQDGAIVIPVPQGESLTGLARELDEETGGAINRAVSEAGFSGQENESLTLYAVGRYARVDLIGLGSEPVDRLTAEDFGGTAAGLNDGSNGTPISILWEGSGNADAARVAFGYVLGDYRFDRLQERRRDLESLAPVTILSNDNGASEHWENDLAHLAAGVYMARDFSSEPANVIYPQSFIDRIRQEFDGIRNVSIRVLEEDELAELGMGALLGVGGGSTRPPRMLLIEYRAGGDGPTIALAGKGITFDTGGISIKPKDGMGLMKGDLGGAGVVSAVALAAARRQSPVNLVALAALAENMPSGSAIRPGDVLTSMSGITIEINSTDAEGRLVLADAVHYAQVEYQPEVLIDVATLTGSAGRAVGDTYAALFSREDELARQLLEASRDAGEPAWRLPLDDIHFELIESDVADIINGGISNAGASIGASFIGSFVNEDQHWAHFDIASVDFLERGTPTSPPGYSAWSVRALDEYLRRHFEQAP